MPVDGESRFPLVEHVKLRSMHEPPRRYTVELTVAWRMARVKDEMKVFGAAADVHTPMRAALR